MYVTRRYIITRYAYKSGAPLILALQLGIRTSRMTSKQLQLGHLFPQRHSGQVVSCLREIVEFLHFDNRKFTQMWCCFVINHADVKVTAKMAFDNLLFTLRSWRQNYWYVSNLITVLNRLFVFPKSYPCAVLHRFYCSPFVTFFIYLSHFILFALKNIFFTLPTQVLFSMTAHFYQKPHSTLLLPRHPKTKKIHLQQISYEHLLETYQKQKMLYARFQR